MCSSLSVRNSAVEVIAASIIVSLLSNSAVNKINLLQHRLCDLRLKSEKNAILGDYRRCGIDIIPLIWSVINRNFFFFSSLKASQLQGLQRELLLREDACIISAS